MGAITPALSPGEREDDIGGEWPPALGFAANQGTRLCREAGHPRSWTPGCGKH